MSDYYIGNGSKRPKLSDYKQKYGWQGQTYYTLDKLKYESKRADYKSYKENQKKASEYASKLRWF